MLTVSENKAKSWEYENGFHWYVPTDRVGKLLSHYEIYKKIVGLPGDVYEFGVFKGASFIRWLHFRDLLETSQSREIKGFDMFGKFPIDGIQRKDDVEFAGCFEADAGEGLIRAELEGILAGNNFRNYSLCEGNIFDTLPEHFAKNPGERIALLHLDVDLYEPTKFAFERCVDRLVPGAVIVFDDYSHVGGASDYVDEICKLHNLKLAKSSYSRSPTYAIWNQQTSA